MPAPEKTYNSDFYEVEPPVIPVKFNRAKTRGKPGPMSEQGFEGFELMKGMNGRSKYRVMKTGDFTLKILGDGYAEIPDTPYNRVKLAIQSKPMIEKPTYNRPIKGDVADDSITWFRNKDGELEILTAKSLKDGDIRIVCRGGKRPARVKPLKGKREFNMRDVKQAELCERVRPWLKDFINVNGALMEAQAI